MYFDLKIDLYIVSINQYVIIPAPRNEPLRKSMSMALTFNRVNFIFFFEERARIVNPGIKLTA